MMAQTIVIATERDTSSVRFCVYRSGPDDQEVYDVHCNFTFRGYDMTTISECDFYNLTEEELDLIKKNSNLV